MSKEFFAAHKWLLSNVRNILDESDAMLSPKYQLIYTIGNQLAHDGRDNRWLVPQKILKQIRIYLNGLGHFGADRIEIDTTLIDRSDVFVPFRIIHESVFEQIKHELIRDFIDGSLMDFPEMDPAMKQNVEMLLSEEEVNSDVLQELKADLTEDDWNISMIVRGLLRFDILKLVLMKRWRVNYGINETGHRKMAVPFKAKDVASEMTEFGHPDVAICFTLLSYYYKGIEN